MENTNIENVMSALTKFVSDECAEHIEADKGRLTALVEELPIDDLEAFMTGYQAATAVASVTLAAGMRRYVQELLDGTANGILVQAARQPEDTEAHVLMAFVAAAASIIQNVENSGLEMATAVVLNDVMADESGLALMPVAGTA